MNAYELARLYHKTYMFYKCYTGSELVLFGCKVGELRIKPWMDMPERYKMYMVSIAEEILTEQTERLVKIGPDRVREFAETLPGIIRCSFEIAIAKILKAGEKLPSKKENLLETLFEVSKVFHDTVKQLPLELRQSIDIYIAKVLKEAKWKEAEPIVNDLDPDIGLESVECADAEVKTIINQLKADVEFVKCFGARVKTTIDQLYFDKVCQELKDAKDANKELQAQLDFVCEENHNLNEVDAEVSELKGRNEKLEAELTELRRPTEVTTVLLDGVVSNEFLKQDNLISGLNLEVEGLLATIKYLRELLQSETQNNCSLCVRELKLRISKLIEIQNEIAAVNHGEICLFQDEIQELKSRNNQLETDLKESKRVATLFNISSARIVAELKDKLQDPENFRGKKQVTVRQYVDKLQERATALTLFRDKLAQALGIQTGRERWWDASKEKKDSIIMNKIAALRSKQ